MPSEPSPHAPPGAGRPSRVGYRVVDLPGRIGGHDRAVAAALWYPTDAEPAEVVYAGGPNRGEVAAGAPVRASADPCPLLVFSHGYGGSAVGSAFFAEALASRGWIVACPDHEDRDKLVALRGGPRRVDRFAYLERALAMAKAGRGFDRENVRYRIEEFRVVLDAVLGSREFGPAIDAERIAAGGHSLGGFGAIALCGAEEGERDARLQAALLFSPALFPFGEEELSAVRVSTMILLGEKERDEVHGGRTTADLLARAFERLPAPKYLVEIRGGTHFSFNMPAASGLVARAWSGTEEDFATVRTYSIAFLERHVAGRMDAEAILSAGDERISAYRRQTRGGRPDVSADPAGEPRPTAPPARGLDSPAKEALP